MATLPTRAESLTAEDWDIQFAELYGKGIFPMDDDNDLLDSGMSGELLTAVPSVPASVTGTPPPLPGSKRGSARGGAGRAAKRPRTEQTNVLLQSFPEIVDDGTYPQVTCEIAQGDDSRELYGGVAWLRANDRPTWFHLTVTHTFPNTNALLDFCLLGRACRGKNHHVDLVGTATFITRSIFFPRGSIPL